MLSGPDLQSPSPAPTHSRPDPLPVPLEAAWRGSTLAENSVKSHCPPPRGGGRLVLPCAFRAWVGLTQRDCGCLYGLVTLEVPSQGRPRALDQVQS